MKNPTMVPSCTGPSWTDGLPSPPAEARGGLGSDASTGGVLKGHGLSARTWVDRATALSDRVLV
eukprot:6328343-Alexandrium_andersonii.AAC.1